MMSRIGRLILALSLILSLALTRSDTTAAAKQQQRASYELPVEVFQVYELPITINETVLIKTKTGYLLKCLLSNGSEFRQLGLTYSMAVMDSMNVKNIVVTRNERVKLSGYQTKSVTFKTPLKLDLKGDERLVLILERVISTRYIWDVLKAKESLAAYSAGDYSITPRVQRLSNQIDTPSLQPKVIY